MLRTGGRSQGLKLKTGAKETMTTMYAGARYRTVYDPRVQAVGRQAHTLRGGVEALQWPA